MPFAVAAIGAGVSTAAGIAGGIMQQGAVKGAQNSANAAQRAAEERARADLAPWRDTGGGANTATADLLGLNGPDAANTAMANYQASPGYQWQLQQGLRATDMGAAARGFGRSGAELKAEQTFGQGLANQDFGQYYNRLFDLSKLGEAAATGQATASTNTGRDIAATDLSAGSALSSIYGNTAKGVGNSINSGLNSLYGMGAFGTSGGGVAGAGISPSGGVTSFNPATFYGTYTGGYV